MEKPGAGVISLEESQTSGNVRRVEKRTTNRRTAPALGPDPRLTVSRRTGLMVLTGLPFAESTLKVCCRETRSEIYRVR